LLDILINLDLLFLDHFVVHKCCTAEIYITLTLNNNGSFLRNQSSAFRTDQTIVYIVYQPVSNQRDVYCCTNQSILPIMRPHIMALKNKSNSCEKDTLFLSLTLTSCFVSCSYSFYQNKWTLVWLRYIKRYYRQHK
jgi:hypothetical protein